MQPIIIKNVAIEVCQSIAANDSPSKNYRFLKVINIREANKGFYYLGYLKGKSSSKNHGSKKWLYTAFQKGYFAKK